MPAKSTVQAIWDKVRGKKKIQTNSPQPVRVPSPGIKDGNAEITQRAIQIRKFRPEVLKRLASQTILKKLPSLLDPAKNAIDVGGNVGHISRFLSQYAKQVYSFEAVGVVFEELKKTAQMVDNITVEKCAISNFCGEADFFVDHQRLSNSGLHNVGEVDVSFKPSTEFKTTKTPVKSIDSLGIPNVGFIKIDVEGSELDVIRGAVQTLRHDSPELLVEIYEPFCKYPASEIFETLMNLGYRCYFYNNQIDNLQEAEDCEQGVRAVQSLHSLHDGDFLFSKLEIDAARTKVA